MVEQHVVHRSADTYRMAAGSSGTADGDVAERDVFGVVQLQGGDGVSVGENHTVTVFVHRGDGQVVSGRKTAAVDDKGFGKRIVSRFKRQGHLSRMGSCQGVHQRVCLRKLEMGVWGTADDVRLLCLYLRPSAETHQQSCRKQLGKNGKCSHNKYFNDKNICD